MIIDDMNFLNKEIITTSQPQNITEFLMNQIFNFFFIIYDVSHIALTHTQWFLFSSEKNEILFQVAKKRKKSRCSRCSKQQTWWSRATITISSSWIITYPLLLPLVRYYHTIKKKRFLWKQIFPSITFYSFIDYEWIFVVFQKNSESHVSQFNNPDSIYLLNKHFPNINDQDDDEYAKFSHFFILV